MSEDRDLEMLTVALAKVHGFLTYGMAEAIAKSALRFMRERIKAEAGTSAENISAENQRADRVDHIGMKR